jgi:hypothetical protein
MAQHSNVSGAFGATGQSASFRPGVDLDTEAREFGFYIAGTFVGTVTLECQANGSTWVPVARTDGNPHTYTAPTPLMSVRGPVSNAAYRLNCTSYTSGSASYWMGQ